MTDPALLHFHGTHVRLRVVCRTRFPPGQQLDPVRRPKEGSRKSSRGDAELRHSCSSTAPRCLPELAMSGLRLTGWIRQFLLAATQASMDSRTVLVTSCFGR